MSGVLEITTHSAEETQALGRSLGESLEIGDICLLSGELGAGKTTLTQGIAWGAGASGYAHSPTFVLVHEYPGRVKVYHLDLYRIDGGELEAHDLAIDELLADGACVVEWAERAPGVFPPEHVRIELGFGQAPDDRRITLDPAGERAERLVEALRGVRAR
jgi:tRNA threonylcarbamoyladenosine biosynthesis protein TsaE